MKASVKCYVVVVAFLLMTGAAIDRLFADASAARVAKETAARMHLAGERIDYLIHEVEIDRSAIEFCEQSGYMPRGLK